MSVINVSDLTFAYEGSSDNIFENVSFCIDTDWKLGFTGRNGRGKTTFLNLLLGKYEYSGSICANIDFEYFPYDISDMSINSLEGFSINRDTSKASSIGSVRCKASDRSNTCCLTRSDNEADDRTNRGFAVKEVYRGSLDIIEEICPGYVYWELVREMNLLEIPEELLYVPYKSLSFGEQAKLQLAAMFLRENSFLLIDEPTNHLDMHGRELLSKYLNTKKGFILVSHDRAFLDGCTDHILAINRTDIEVTKGNFSVWLENKERRDSFELAKNEKLKREIKRLEKTAAEKSEWSDRAEKRKIGFDPLKTEKSLGRRPCEGAKAKKAMKRSKAIEKRCIKEIEEKSSLLKNIEISESLKIEQENYHCCEMITFHNVSVSFGERTVFSGLNFSVKPGERVWLKGRNGCGKTTVMKIICGCDIPYSGDVYIGRGLEISYVPQDASWLSGSLFEFAHESKIDESIFLAILRKLDFSRGQFEKDMRDLSSGQKKKVLLAASLCSKAHIHIWDEPMNYIDVISRMQLEQIISEYNPTLVFAEHDKTFCNKIADKIIEM